MNVYILPHRSEPRFKIGKANDLSARIAQIGKKNELDISKVFVLEAGSKERAFEIEKSLHRLFSPARLEGDRDAWGDGFSEWFCASVYPQALAVAKTMEARPFSAPPTESRTPTPKNGLKRLVEEKHASLGLIFANFVREKGVFFCSPDKKSLVEMREGRLTCLSISEEIDLVRECFGDLASEIGPGKMRSILKSGRFEAPVSRSRLETGDPVFRDGEELPPWGWPLGILRWRKALRARERAKIGTYEFSSRFGEGTIEKPILILERETPESRTDPCPFCGETHSHGTPDGPRVPHCHIRPPLLLEVGGLVASSDGHYLIVSRKKSKGEEK